MLGSMQICGNRCTHAAKPAEIMRIIHYHVAESYEWFSEKKLILFDRCAIDVLGLAYVFHHC